MALFRSNTDRHQRRRATTRMSNSRRSDSNTRTPSLRQLPPDLVDAIAEDPRFGITTLDQGTWIDPFTGEGVPCPKGFQVAAYEHLLERETWKDRDPLPMESVVEARWKIDLYRMIETEPRLRIFNPTSWEWLNPFTGEVEAEVKKSEQGITSRTIAAMAEALAQCPQANGEMLSLPALRQGAINLGFRSATGDTTTSGEEGTTSRFRRQTASDLARAREVQQKMLGELPEVPGYRLSVYYRPHESVGGDFYDAVSLDSDRVLVILGDVAGHGVQAALLVASALKALRLISRHEKELAPLMTALNDELRQDLLAGQFVTAFAGILDSKQGTLEFVLAGHHPAVVLNVDGPTFCRQVGKSGMALGLVGGERFKSALEPTTISIAPGEMLVQFTDALLEAIDGDGEQITRTHLYGTLLSHAEEDLDVLVRRTCDYVIDFANGQIDDDLTLLAIAPKEGDGTQSTTYMPGVKT